MLRQMIGVLEGRKRKRGGRPREADREKERRERKMMTKITR